MININKCNFVRNGLGRFPNFYKLNVWNLMIVAGWCFNPESHLFIHFYVFQPSSVNRFQWVNKITDNHLHLNEIFLKLKTNQQKFLLIPPNIEKKLARSLLPSLSSSSEHLSTHLQCSPINLIKGRPFLKGVVSLWALPVSGREV